MVVPGNSWLRVSVESFWFLEGFPESFRARRCRSDVAACEAKGPLSVLLALNGQKCLWSSFEESCHVLPESQDLSLEVFLIFCHSFDLPLCSESPDMLRNSVIVILYIIVTISVSGNYRDGLNCHSTPIARMPHSRKASSDLHQDPDVLPLHKPHVRSIITSASACCEISAEMCQSAGRRRVPRISPILFRGQASLPQRYWQSQCKMSTVATLRYGLQLRLSRSALEQTLGCSRCPPFD